MRQARDRQRESIALSGSNPGKSVANIFRHRSSSKRGHELPPLLNDNKVFLIEDTDKADHNKFASFPREIFCLLTLEYISLSSNALCKLPTGWDDLHRLKELDLSCNSIHDFFPLLVLDSVEVLKLNQNKIRHIPQAIANLRRLVHFDVRANRIDELPRCLIDLKELESLSISDNPLTFPPLTIASRGLPHILAFLSVRGGGSSPESPNTDGSRLAVTPHISVVVPGYSGSEEEGASPDQEMKEVPETETALSPSMKQRDSASGWWRVTAPRTFDVGPPSRSPNRKTVDLKFSRGSAMHASAPLTASNLPPKPALRSRHVSDSVASPFPDDANNSGDEDKKWKEYADSHFSRSGPTTGFFMGDDEFTPPDFPLDQDEMMWEKPLQSDTDSNSTSQIVQKDSECSIAPSTSGTTTSVSRIRTPQWAKTEGYTVVRRLDRHEMVSTGPSPGTFWEPIPVHNSYPAQPLPSTSPQKPHPPQRSVRARPPSTPQTSFSPSVPSTSSSSPDSETFLTVVRRRRTPVYPRRRKPQSAEDQEGNQNLSIPVAQPRVPRTVMHLPEEDLDFTSEDSELELTDHLPHQPYISKSGLRSQSGRAAEGSSRSTIYRSPPAVSLQTSRPRNGYGQCAAHSVAHQRGHETSERAAPGHQSSQRLLAPQPHPPQRVHSDWSSPQRHPGSGAWLDANGDSHRGRSVACQMYPQMMDYAELWRSTAAQLKLLLESRLPTRLPTDPPALASLLHTGVCLATFLNSLLGYPAIKRIHSVPSDSGPAHFHARQNLTACRELIRRLGVPKHRLFSVSRILESDSTVGLLGLLHCLQTLIECLARQFDNQRMLRMRSGNKLAEPNSRNALLPIAPITTSVLPSRGQKSSGSGQQSSPPVASSSRAFQNKFLPGCGMYSDV
ncbi:hypothetical protein SprV_0301247500 [Sparganum proliferum]